MPCFYIVGRKIGGKPLTIVRNWVSLKREKIRKERLVGEETSPSKNLIRGG
jgi:hypothetical protein